MRGALACAALSLAPACGAPPPPAEPPPATPITRPKPAPPPADLGGAAGEHRSARFDLLLPLPDGAGWRVDDAGTPWLVATHAASSTTLLVRAWRPGGLVNRQACEEQARLWRDLPGREGAAVAERRRIDAPAGFDTEVEIGVATGIEEAAQPGAPVTGFVAAFGGWARRCFAYAAVTRAEGAGAARVVAARLAALVEVSLAGVRLESELQPALRRGPNL